MFIISSSQIPLKNIKRKQKDVPTNILKKNLNYDFKINGPIQSKKGDKKFKTKTFQLSKNSILLTSEVESPIYYKYFILHNFYIYSI